MGTAFCVMCFNSFGILPDQMKLSSGFDIRLPQLALLQQSSNKYLKGKSQVNLIYILLQVLL